MSVSTQNCTIKYGDGASPEVFTSIASIIDFSGPTGQRAVINTTRLASTAREKAVGLPDYGQVSYNLIWDSDNAYDSAIWAKFKSGVATNFQVVFDNSPQDVINFSAYVLGHTFNAGEDDVVRGSVTLEIDGTVTDNI